MTITVRKANKEDMPTVLKMFKNLGEYLDAENGPQLNLEDLYRDGGFEGDNPQFVSFLAEDSELKDSNGIPLAVGHVMCSYMYSWDGKTLYLIGLYVIDSHRSRGIGKMLCFEILKHSKETKCNRLEFHAFDWNPANKFYEKLGASNVTAPIDTIEFIKIH